MVGGIAVSSGLLPGNHWSILFPVRKSTVALFGLDAVEMAARIALYENLPPGWKMNEEGRTTIHWYDQEIRAGEPPMNVVALLAALEADNGTE